MLPAKKIAFSFIAIVGIPALFFLALEGILRISGVGTDYDYFHSVEIDGVEHFQDNKAFANQFYPASLGVAPLNNTITAQRDDDVVRVYVLGGSAAQGFPHVNHGLDRHLGAHLSAALPGKKIEVINTAMTSVNSHVVYEVARTLPANSADYAVILMGNNEVVGPYGPSTFNQNFLSSMTMIRTLQSLKRTRTWQAIEALVQAAQPASAGEEMEWEGMQMFSGFSVTHDDPRLEHVYSHYERNLRDIIELLQDKNMHVILSSVPVNLRHSAPFGSAHKTGLSEAQLQQWQSLNSAAKLLFAEQEWAAAVKAYQELLTIDDEYADSHFRLATALENMSEFNLAKTHFEAALRFDTKRFRTDGVLNAIVAKVGAEEAGESLTYVDSVALFDGVKRGYVPGWDLLHEHVHFDYDGNYYLAREFTQAIMADLQPSQRYTRLSKQRAAERIGFPNHETNQVMNRLLGMVKKSPFTEQSNAAELEAFTTARRDEIVAEVGSPADAVARRQPLVEQGLADWKIHYELAELNRFLRNKDATYFHLTEVIRLYPHNHESYIKLAEYLSAEGQLSQANEHLKRSLHYTRNDETKDTQALGWIGLNYMKMNDYEQGSDYLEQVIDDYSDQIGATIRAYGALIKYARERNEHDDFQSYLAGVKRYAKGLIEQDRVAEFPLLYRRMAQIMTIAGDTAEAERWQQMQAENT
ncbi:tetratricopeptide repeat protein [Alteromonas sp. ASW11-36]|uniref:Tetratricopeptide repeat protein n=1 Tax=Alteromonas arenosi TaxID=3055817 RepID=A0ABT7SW43_9ALTE|nr:tetratricopeptide repeat protein [Alteromonas sp. ASW11-36]MDM7860388.1 tetratricopeptide repeat protein [Alteromonas sp. ASW11-36]